MVFENPEHDFPQKITCTLNPDGSVLAVIEGSGPEGELKRIEFAYGHVPWADGTGFGVDRIFLMNGASLISSIP